MRKNEYATAVPLMLTVEAREESCDAAVCWLSHC